MGIACAFGNAEDRAKTLTIDTRQPTWNEMFKRHQRAMQRERELYGDETFH